MTSTDCLDKLERLEKVYIAKQRVFLQEVLKIIHAERLKKKINELARKILI